MNPFTPNDNNFLNTNHSVSNTIKYGIGFIAGFIISIFWFVSSDDQNSTKETISKSKGNICLIIDDFGYSMNETIISYLSLPIDFTSLLGITSRSSIASAEW